MKLKNNIHQFFVLFIVVLFLSFIIYRINKKLNQSEIRRTQIVCLYNELENLWTERIEWNLYLYNNRINYLYLHSETKDSITIKDIVGVNPKLVLYIKENTCSACIDTSLYYLNKWSDKIGIENVLVMSDMKKTEQLKLLMRFGNIDLPVYSAIPELKLPQEFPPSTIFMIIGEHLCIENALVADKYMGSVINYYLSCVNESIFDGESAGLIENSIK